MKGANVQNNATHAKIGTLLPFLGGDLIHLSDMGTDIYEGVVEVTTPYFNILWICTPAGDRKLVDANQGKMQRIEYESGSPRIPQGPALAGTDRVDSGTFPVAVILDVGDWRARSVAHLLCLEGMSIVCVDIDGDVADDAADYIRRIGGRAVGIAADVMSPGHAEEIIELTVALYGVPGLIVAAGSCHEPKLRIAAINRLSSNWNCHAARIKPQGTGKPSVARSKKSVHRITPAQKG